jgi:hypothetical protein
MEILSIDAFSYRMATMCLQKAATHKYVAPLSKLTIKDLRVLLVRRKERALYHKSVVSSHRGAWLSSRISIVSFIPSPFCIAVHSDSFIELYISTESALSPVFSSKAKRIGDQSTFATGSLSDPRTSKESAPATSNSTEERL